MSIVSANKFLLWEKKQIQKGGDYESLSLLIDFQGGLDKAKVNLLKINPDSKVILSVSLETLEKTWDFHLRTSTPMQYLVGACYWRDLNLEVSNKVLIPRPETELMIDIVYEVIKKKMIKKYLLISEQVLEP